MKHCVVLAAAAAGALAMGGCSMSAPSFGPSTSVAAVTPAPAPIVYGAFLDGPVGQKLDPADKDKVLAAEEDSLASGQRRSWKGGHGTFGYVEPGAAPAETDASGATCRAFTSTVFVAGRPQVGHGRGCQGADGTYHVVA